MQNKIAKKIAKKLEEKLEENSWGIFEMNHSAFFALRLWDELKQSGLFVERQKKLPLIYETVELKDAYRLDLLVENKIIIELKSVESLHNVHFKQLLTYLKLSNRKVGYLINFNVERLKGHIHRKVY